MNIPEAICYATFADKRRDYPRRIIPAIFALALDCVEHHYPMLRRWLAESDILMLPRGPEQLAELHEAARAGKYRKAAQPCDTVQPAGVTLEQGAPCSGWAVVIGAALSALGYAWRLVTAGDSTDPYRHVYAQAFHGGHWYTLDAKGSPRGQRFDHDAAREHYEVVRYWRAA